MEYFVADSYKGFKYDVEKAYEKNGKMYVKAHCKCDRCVKGVYVCRVENNQLVPHPAYGGVCLKCHGTGVIQKEIRLYTAKEKASMDRAAARRQEKKEAENQARIEKNNLESEKNMKEWWAKNGIGEDGLVWIITGDTYAIKDKLKELGCRFNPTLKWYSPISLDLPKGYGMMSFNFNDLYEWQPQLKTAFLYENAQAKIEKALAEAAGPSLSEYVGEEGERIRNITAIYSSTRGFEGRFGYTFIHTFYSGDDCLVWFTTKELDFEKGQTVDLTGTIVAHDEFRGVKTTKINRCIIKKIE